MGKPKYLFASEYVVERFLELNGVTAHRGTPRSQLLSQFDNTVATGLATQLQARRQGLSKGVTAQAVRDWLYGTTVKGPNLQDCAVVLGCGTNNLVRNPPPYSVVTPATVGLALKPRKYASGIVSVVVDRFSDYFDNLYFGYPPSTADAHADQGYRGLCVFQHDGAHKHRYMEVTLTASEPSGRFLFGFMMWDFRGRGWPLFRVSQAINVAYAEVKLENGRAVALGKWGPVFGNAAVGPDLSFKFLLYYAAEPCEMVVWAPPEAEGGATFKLSEPVVSELAPVDKHWEAEAQWAAQHNAIVFPLAPHHRPKGLRD